MLIYAMNSSFLTRTVAVMDLFCCFMYFLSESSSLLKENICILVICMLEYYFWKSSALSIICRLAEGYLAFFKLSPTDAKQKVSFNYV